jgi:hypothetical protein
MGFEQKALPLVERGFRVFPLYGSTPFGCTCPRKKECPAIGKHPLLRNWPELVSNRIEDIQAWGIQFPSANVAIATGEGLLVIDVDDPSSPVSKEILPLLPETLTATTGRGCHHFFSVPTDTPLSANAFGGLDVRYTHAYVVGAGSRHKSGKLYWWVNTLPIVELPDEVIAKLVGLSKGESKPRVNTKTADRKAPRGGYYWYPGVRRNKLMAYAANLQYKEYTDKQIKGSTRDENDRRCRPPLEQWEVDGIVDHILSKPKGR